MQMIRGAVCFFNLRVCLFDLSSGVLGFLARWMALGPEIPDICLVVLGIITTCGERRSSSRGVVARESADMTRRSAELELVAEPWCESDGVGVKSSLLKEKKIWNASRDCRPMFGILWQ